MFAPTETAAEVPKDAAASASTDVATDDTIDHANATINAADATGNNE